MAASLVRTSTQISSIRQIIKEIYRNDSVLKHAPKIAFLADVPHRLFKTTSVYGKKRKTGEEKQRTAVAFVPKPKTHLPVVDIWRNMTVEELAHSAQRTVKDVLSALLFTQDKTNFTPETVIANPTTIYDAVRKLGAKYRFVKKPVNEQPEEEKGYDAVKRPPPDPSMLVKRHPVVTIMGHVDHGKTTLLDTLRQTSVVDTEFGGITQHIGAFNVTLQTGERMTFLDTPGHAAFSTMRARGAQVTDIVVLVVAADDGVMEQTVQSIEMAQNANVPIVVAINKIDKPEANIERTQKMLAQRGILVEELGGDVQSVNISALKNINLDTLVQTIAMQADLIQLTGDPTGLVEAVVIESTNDVGRGKLATVLIERGTLRKGAVLVCGLAWAKIRTMFDHAGKPIAEAKLSEAVQTTGWRELPYAGDEVLEVENERRAHMVMRFRQAQQAALKAKEHQEAADKKHQEYLIEYKEQLQKKRAMGRYRKISGVATTIHSAEDNVPNVNVLIKSDVIGSVEAILDVLETYGDNEKCRLTVVHYGVGNVTQSDVELADAFNAIIYPFNVSIPKDVLTEIKEKGVSVRPYNVIYKLIDNIKEEINSKLPDVTVEEILGEAQVLQQFEVSEKKKKWNVAGCRCVKGNLKKSALYRLCRGGETIFTGKLASMRHLKGEVNTIKTDVECGLRFEDPAISFEPGDVLICFVTRKEHDQVHWDPGF